MSGKPATYERILKHIEGHQITVHCTVTRQQARRDGYSKSSFDFWQANADTRLIWISLYTPQVGELSMERLTAGDRAKVIGEMRRLRPRYSKFQMFEGILNVYATPPESPDDCIFAQTTECFSSDFEHRIAPCQFGGKPDCQNCGCLASAGLEAIGRHRLGGGLAVGNLLRITRGGQVRRAGTPARSPPADRYGLCRGVGAGVPTSACASLIPALRGLQLTLPSHFRAGTSVAHPSGVRIASSTLLLVVVLATSGPSLSAQQSAKQETDPQDEGRLKSIARKLGTLASPDDKDGISISAGIIVAGSGLSGGAGYRKSNLFSSPIDLEVEATMSYRLYQAYRASIGLLGERSSTLEFDTADSRVSSLFNASAPKTPGSAVFLEMRYRDYPRHTYYGTGIDSLEENRSDYALRGLSVEGAWQWQLTPTLGVGARGGWLGLDIGQGQRWIISISRSGSFPRRFSAQSISLSSLRMARESCTTLEATPGSRKTGG